MDLLIIFVVVALLALLVTLVVTARNPQTKIFSHHNLGINILSPPPVQKPKPEEMDEIIPGLFLGGRDVIYEAEKYGIKNILNLTMHPDPPAITSMPGIRMKQIAIHDSTETNIARHFPETNAFIQQALNGDQDLGQASGKVLVHCELGISRSPTVVAAYLMSKFGMTSDQALAFIASKRPAINPNPAFLQQLKNI